MSKAILYNSENLALTIIDEVKYFEKKDVGNNLMDYKIESETLGTVDLKGSAFSIAFFDDSIEINERQDITDIINQSQDEKEFIKMDEIALKDAEIETLNERIETLEGAILELMETVL